MELLIASVLFISGADCKECKAPAVRTATDRVRTLRPNVRDRVKGFKLFRRGVR